jgi:hypothetical protein
MMKKEQDLFDSSNLNNSNNQKQLKLWIIIGLKIKIGQMIGLYKCRNSKSILLILKSLLQSKIN